MRATILPKAIILEGRGPYSGQGVYYGLSTASEVFIIFTTQLCLMIIHICAIIMQYFHILTRARIAT